MDQQITDAHQPRPNRVQAVRLRRDRPRRCCDPVGPAPYLDYDRPEPGHQRPSTRLRKRGVVGRRARSDRHGLGHRARQPQSTCRTSPTGSAPGRKDPTAGAERLIAEINYQDARYAELVDQQSHGQGAEESAPRPPTGEPATWNAASRPAWTTRPSTNGSALAPRGSSALALVIPQGLPRPRSGQARPADRHLRQGDRRSRTPSRRRRHGRGASTRAHPHEMPHNNPGFDIRSSETRDGQVIRSRSRAGSTEQRTSRSPGVKC